jgi:hypothetical protein
MASEQALARSARGLGRDSGGVHVTLHSFVQPPIVEVLYQFTTTELRCYKGAIRFTIAWKRG